MAKDGKSAAAMNAESRPKGMPKSFGDAGMVKMFMPKGPMAADGKRNVDPQQKDGKVMK